MVFEGKIIYTSIEKKFLNCKILQQRLLPSWDLMLIATSFLNIYLH